MSVCEADSVERHSTIDDGGDVQVHGFRGVIVDDKINDASVHSGGEPVGNDVLGPDTGVDEIRLMAGNDDEPVVRSNEGVARSPAPNVKRFAQDGRWAL